VEIGAEAALFPEKEYINGIFFAVQVWWYLISIQVKSSRPPLTHVQGGLLLGVGDGMGEGELNTELHYLCKFFLRYCDKTYHHSTFLSLNVTSLNVRVSKRKSFKTYEFQNVNVKKRKDVTVVSVI
jgi:hypothetical protein